MEGEKKKLHFLLFAWLAQGHINPFVHISKALAIQGHTVSFLSMPVNIFRIKSSLQLHEWPRPDRSARTVVTAHERSDDFTANSELWELLSFFSGLARSSAYFTSNWLWRFKSWNVHNVEGNAWRLWDKKRMVL
jgi:hypothetical protein